MKWNECSTWMQCLKRLKYNWNLLQILTCNCLLKKESEEVFHTSLIDKVKQIMNTWNDMILINQVSMLHILMQTIYIIKQWVNIFLMVHLRGWEKRNWYIWFKSIRENSSYGYTLEVTLSILMNCIIFIMIIH